MAKKYLGLAAMVIILSMGAVAYSFTRNNRADLPVPADTGINGTVILGPTCPVQSIDDVKGGVCDSRPYETRLVVKTSDQSRVIKEFGSDQYGTFRVAVPPGEYSIRSADTASVKPYCSSDAIKVTAGNFTGTRVICDTGIR